jgi:hypothetical protein
MPNMIRWLVGRISPLHWLYLALGTTGSAAFLLWFASGSSESGWLRSWTPNIATESLSILVTVAVVNRILEKGEQRRLKPRVDRAMRDVGGDYRMLVRAIAWDYKATHVGTFEPVPETSLGVLDHWDANVEREDTERQVHGAGDIPFAISGALNTATSLQRVRESDREVLEPDVVAAIDEFEEDARLAFSVYGGLPDATRDEAAREAIYHVVAGARQLGEALIRHDRQWLEEGPVMFARSSSWGTDLQIRKGS